MEGRTRLKLRVTSHALGVMTLRFADSLNVSSVIERRIRPAAVPARAQSEQPAGEPADSPVARDFPMTLTMNYSGRLARSSIRRDPCTPWSSPDPTCRRSDSATNPTRRYPDRAGGAEVAVQQSQLLVSAEPGDRLTPPPASASPCRRNTAWWDQASPRWARRRRPRRRRSKDRRAPFRASRTRSWRRSRSATSACSSAGWPGWTRRPWRSTSCRPRTRRRPIMRGADTLARRSSGCKRAYRHSAGRRAQHRRAQCRGEQAPGIARREALGTAPRSCGCTVAHR